MSDSCLKFLDVGTGPAARRIAVRARAQGAAPGLFWLGGFKSDMKGTKAAALDDWAGRAGPRLHPLRLFRPRRIRRRLRRTAPSAAGWRTASRCSTAFATGPQVLVGSSMGGWMALLLVRELQRRATASATRARSPAWC